MVEGVNAVAGSVVEAPDYGIPPAEAPSDELGKDAFLKLLVAQLKYQDPLEPSSSEEFIATTAQFTVVEKLDELTKQGANTALVNSLTTASALVGREVTTSQNGEPVTAVVEQSRIVSGTVVLDTDQGSINLEEIVSVGARPAVAQQSAAPVAPVVDQVPASVVDLDAETVTPVEPPADTAETSNESAGSTVVANVPSSAPTEDQTLAEQAPVDETQQDPDPESPLGPIVAPASGEEPESVEITDEFDPFEAL